MSEYELHLLIMIEAAQRAGHSEREIVRLVEEHLGDGPATAVIPDEHRLVRRLLRRERVPKAA